MNISEDIRIEKSNKTNKIYLQWQKFLNIYDTGILI